MNLMQLQDITKGPKELHEYISWLENELETPISIISVGPDRKQTLFR